MRPRWSFVVTGCKLPAGSMVRNLAALCMVSMLSWACRAQPTQVGTATPENETITATPSTVATATQAGTPSNTATPPPMGTSTQEAGSAQTEEVCPVAGSTDFVFASEPGASVSEVFEQQILEYLNDGGSPAGLADILGVLTMLGGSWEARPQVEVVDVTGNEAPEVVLELTFFEEGQYSESALFVFRCADGEYAGGTVLSRSGQVLSRDHPDGIRAILDMNANGIPDIVHSYISIAGSHAYFIREFSILEWNGDEFVDLLVRDENGVAAQADTGDGELSDLDGNGTVELFVSNSIGAAYPDLGPQRERADIWEWTGDGFERTRWEFTPPEFRIHAIWDGDDAVRFGEYESALTFYQQAVFDEALFGWSPGRLWPDSYYSGTPTPVPDPEERHRLNAYGRYRIMLLHAVQDNLAEAEIVFNTLQENYSGPVVGSQYAALAEAFWNEFSISGDVEGSCAKAIEMAGTEHLQPLGSSYYGVGQRDYRPEDICPF